MLRLTEADDAKYGALIRLHAQGLSQRDIAAEIGKVSQRWVCYMLKSLRLTPNGYRTTASKRKRSSSMTAVARTKRMRTLAETVVDPAWQVEWPLTSGTIPRRLGYRLFSSLVTKGIVAHGDNVQILPMDGTILMRAKEDRVAALVGRLVAGTRLRVGGTTCEVGVPVVRSLDPSPRLSSWCVQVKDKSDEPAMAEWLRRELDRHGINGRESVGERRVVKIKGVVLVGYAVRISRLNPRESLLVQTIGLGGRRRFGCGVFVPC